MPRMVLKQGFNTLQEQSAMRIIQKIQNNRTPTKNGSNNKKLQFVPLMPTASFHPVLCE
jgi:hypothetical protein